MPWRETTTMNERRSFIRAWETELFEVTELCRHYGISRPTAYKWIHRYQELGVEGLTDKSRRPERCPGKTAAAIEDAIVGLRKKRPRWGPKKILVTLREEDPEIRWPAVSTVGEVLKRHGLVRPRKLRKRWKHPGTPPILARRSNELWTIDFKGQFRLGDKSVCYPLTIQDRWSRYIIACRALSGPFLAETRKVMEQVFREYGLPERIRSDNGGPFVSRAIGGLTKLNVWWTCLGIDHERTQKGRPDQNGAHERMHRELKAETASPPKNNVAAQDAGFDMFREDYNFDRPHEGLGQIRPGTLWVPSPRRYPDHIEQPQYPGYFELRKVDSSGHFKLRGKQLFLSEALVGCTIGMEPVRTGVWYIFFGKHRLGHLDERTGRIYK